MLTGRISIDRVHARCPAKTEALQARLRLSHLLQGVDIAPRSVSPQAILLIRRAVVLRRISLSSFNLLPDWEQEAREILTGLCRSAVRPLRGRIPAGADAVLFADSGEWLACLGLAVQSRDAAQTLYWRAALHGDGGSSSRALARAWAIRPRYVPAAIAYLAEWGHAPDVLQLFSPQESNVIFHALAEEWTLLKPELQSNDAAMPRTAAATQTSAPTVLKSVVVRESEPDSQAVRTAREAAAEEPARMGATDSREAKERAELRPAPPWARWLPQAKNAVERLPLETQRLLAFAVALFHAPAQARSASFASAVSRWLHQVVERQEQKPQRPREVATEIAPRKAQRNIETSAPTAHSSLKAANEPSAEARVHVSERRVSQPEVAATDAASRVEEDAHSCERAEAEALRQSFWQGLDGCRTEVGGVLFLLNLLRQTELPECFDRELSLSQHISGWGLAELLGKALLGALNEAYRDDPMWPVLARLDGRAPHEIPSANLPDAEGYHIPAEWLKRFDDREQAWQASEAGARLTLRHHERGFIIADCPREAMSLQAQAATELERYRAQGINARLEQAAHASASHTGGMPDDAGAEERLFQSGGIAWRLIPEWPDLPRSLRRWMQWTFPFLEYVLRRALGAETDAPDELARLLLVKPGTLYCTATHVDLLISMEQIALPVRRAGLDVNPGWLRDLMRVVSFHFE